MRERLIELLQEASTEAGKHFRETTKMVLAEKGRFNSRDDIDRRNIYEVEADHLLTNGVIVPPVKVGDVFYGINETSYDEYEVLGFKIGKHRCDDEDVLIALTIYEMEFVWGEEAFATKEDAENALKERERE